MEKYLNLAAVRQCTESEGPGKRFAIWVQGCKQRCPDCCNQHMQEFKKAHIIECDDLMSLILKAKNEFAIEGVSFIGGEPLLQAEGLSYIAGECKKNNLSVLVFTGFTYNYLKTIDDINIVNLLKKTDILVDGLYDKTQPDLERDWVGSKNQNVIFLSDRYHRGVEFTNKEHKMEIMVSEKELLINGWPF